MDHGLEYGKRLTYLVDAAYAAQHGGDELRTHLGASVLGDKCDRAIWFRWRWAAAEVFEGRMLRLFARGQNEEQVFTDILERTGATVWTKDESGNQFRVSAYGGHVGGSMDGIVKDLPELQDTPVLLEMKTHNDKSFKSLLTKGLKESKPQHFRQAQVYMHLGGLRWCLYCAVNKNTDELWFYLFEHEPQVGDWLVRRAGDIVFTESRPPRISENSGWFECQFCSARGVCFGFAQPKENCRTCASSQPTPDGRWHCLIGQSEIETEPQKGCNFYQVNPEMKRQ